MAKAYRSIQNSLPNRRVEDWEASNGHIKDTTRLFHGPWHDACSQTHMCAAIQDVKQTRFRPFSQVCQIFRRRKCDANKQDFEVQLKLTWKVMFDQPPKQ